MGALKLENLPHYTYEDYKLWEGKWELIYGFPYAMSPSPTIEHQDISDMIAMQLYLKLKECKKCHRVTAVDWKVNEDTVVCPDNYVVCGAPIFKKRYSAKAPSIIFEILSPSTKRKDKTQKFELYEENGVKFYIMVEPSGKFAEIYELKKGKYRLQAKIKDESFEFKLKECSFEFDFGDIFEE